MTMVKFPCWPLHRLCQPGGTLLVGLFFCCLLAIAPGTLTRPLRGCMQLVTLPAISATGRLRDLACEIAGCLHGLWRQSSRQADLFAEVEHLRAHNRQLEAALLASRWEGSPRESSGQLEHDPLVSADLVLARVLGRQAQGILARHDLLNAGSKHGIAAHDWVVDAPLSIDRGLPAGVRPGNLVLCGRSIWGRIVSVNDYCGTVKRLTDKGYSDLVQLVTYSQGQYRQGPQGIIEGSGAAECSIRLIAAADSVNVGDLVVSAGHEGLLRDRLLCGKVTHAHLATGASHWEVRMLPAIGRETPDVVGIIRGQVQSRR